MRVYPSADAAVAALRPADLTVTPIPPLPDALRDRILAEASARAEEILHAPSLTPADVHGTCFYVSNRGDDNADGRSPAAAWQSMGRLMRAQNDGTVAAGDGVFFERGSRWNAVYPTERTGLCALVLKPGVTYSAYGEGERPLFTNCLEGGGAENWLPTPWENIWVYAHDAGGLYSDIGNIICDGGRAYGIKVTPGDPSDPFKPGVKSVRRGPVTNGIDVFTSGDIEVTSPAALTHNLEYLHDGPRGRLYLYWDRGNPGASFADMKISRRGHVLRSDILAEDIRIDSIAVKYGGSHGIATIGMRNFTVTNCVIGWIGGSLQETDPGWTVHYGNGVENWGYCDGFTVRDCIIYQCYDVTVTTQYTTSAPEVVVMRNVDFSNNVFACSDYMLELFNRVPTPENAVEVSRFEHGRFNDNYMIGAGYGFTQQRPDKNGNFAKVDLPVCCDAEFRGNRCLYAAAFAFAVSTLELDGTDGGMRVEENIVAMGRGRFIVRSNADPIRREGPRTWFPYTDENVSIFSAYGLNRGGEFYSYEHPLLPEEARGVYEPTA